MVVLPLSFLHFSACTGELATPGGAPVVIGTDTSPGRGIDCLIMASGTSHSFLAFEEPDGSDMFSWLPLKIREQ